MHSIASIIVYHAELEVVHVVICNTDYCQLVVGGVAARGQAVSFHSPSNSYKLTGAKLLVWNLDQHCKSWCESGETQKIAFLLEAM